MLSPKPFSEALKSLNFVNAMDFIEDHIVRNGFVTEDQKLKLIYSREMAPYSFVGALIHYSMLNFTEEDQGEDIRPDLSDFDK